RRAGRVRATARRVSAQSGPTRPDRVHAWANRNPYACAYTAHERAVRATLISVACADVDSELPSEKKCVQIPAFLAGNWTHAQ
ncbi:MAG: hypothetical protein ACKVKB_02175, partial [Candidatus Nanopelagicales bacterium]